MIPEAQAKTVATRLKAAGFNVVSTTMPPRDWSEKAFKPNAVLLHHTASTSVTSREYEQNDVSVIKHVSWGPPGAQFYVGRTGTIYVICRGGANHAGSGGALVKQGIPNDQGNYFMWGIEVQSAGYKKDWTRKQWVAVHRLTAELLIAMGQNDASRVWRHKDYDDDSGKVDTVYSLREHRAEIRRQLKAASQSRREKRLLRLKDSLIRRLKAVRERLKEL